MRIPTRGREAAAGLEGVGPAAERSGEEAALQEAVLGLQTIAPDAVPGRFALVLAQKPDAEPEELVSLLPGAIAAAIRAAWTRCLPLWTGAGGDRWLRPGAAPISRGGSKGPANRSGGRRALAPEIAPSIRGSGRKRRGARRRGVRQVRRGVAGGRARSPVGARW